jgi:hypothetical protein
VVEVDVFEWARAVHVFRPCFDEQVRIAYHRRSLFKLFTKLSVVDLRGLHLQSDPTCNWRRVSTALPVWQYTFWQKKKKQTPSVLYAVFNSQLDKHFSSWWSGGRAAWGSRLERACSGSRVWIPRRARMFVLSFLLTCVTDQWSRKDR